MGVAKELYFKMQEEQVNQLPIETLAELHRLGAEWRYYDVDKQKDFERAVVNLGFDYLLIRSLQEFKQKINEIL